MIGVKQRKLLLAPGFCLQLPCGGHGELVVQCTLVPGFDVVGADVHLPVVFQGVEGFELKEVDLDVVFFDHKVALKVGVACGLEAQLVEVKVLRDGFIAHGQFGAYRCEHIGCVLVCNNRTLTKIAH